MEKVLLRKYSPINVVIFKLSIYFNAKKKTSEEHEVTELPLLFQYFLISSREQELEPQTSITDVLDFFKMC